MLRLVNSSASFHGPHAVSVGGLRPRWLFYEHSERNRGIPPVLRDGFDSSISKSSRSIERGRADHLADLFHADSP